ncbi:unnamed protein product [Ixodes persulcatus]
MLLRYAGDEVCDIYETLPATATADSTSGTAPNAYKLAVDQLTKDFDPKANYEYQRCLFRQERQLGDESIDTYHTRYGTSPCCADSPTWTPNVPHHSNLLVGNPKAQVTPQAGHDADTATRTCAHLGDGRPASQKYGKRPGWTREWLPAGADTPTFTLQRKRCQRKRPVIPTTK